MLKEIAHKMVMSKTEIDQEAAVIRSKMGVRTLCQLGYEVGTSELGEFMRKHGTLTPPPAQNVSTAPSTSAGVETDQSPTESPCPTRRTATGL